ncbi:MAG: DUF853 family protein [Azospirillaceae bacterium]
MADGGARAGTIFVGGGEGRIPQHLVLKRANRHGLIAGATGTGKTVTLQILAEGLSRAGTPVFMADVKGDLSGISQPGVAKGFLAERAAAIGLSDYVFEPCPTVFWDLWGEKGHPVRTTVSELGPMLLGRLLGLNDVQQGVLDLCFTVADDQGLLLLDLKDLRAMLTHVGDSAAELRTVYGNVSAASVGAIQRRLLSLDRQGGETFFGEPALTLADFLTTAPDGRGTINVLAADRLIESPQLYGTFLLWLLSELFESLPEVGDPERPVLVFFFDEAHLLFDDAPDALVDKVAQVCRLIRSKGVGVYFVTQNPDDVPEVVLGQLGNRVQHALRAFTPRDARAVKTAAETFRPNPAFDAAAVIGELGVGEALVSLLDAKGVPGIVERTLIRPPASRLGPADEAERAAVIARSPIGRRYDAPVDRESAYEILAERARAAERAEDDAREREEREERRAREEAEAEAADHRRSRSRIPSSRAPRRTTRRSRRQSVGESLAKSAARQVGRELGRALFRGILGTLGRSR